jgi:chromosome segregation ATPase
MKMKKEEAPPLTEAERHHIALYRRDKERKELLNQIFQLETQLTDLKETLNVRERINAGLRATCRHLKFQNERLDEQVKEYRKIIDLDTAVNDLLARIKSV